MPEPEHRQDGRHRLRVLAAQSPAGHLVSGRHPAREGPDAPADDGASGHGALTPVASWDAGWLVVCADLARGFILISAGLAIGVWLIDRLKVVALSVVLGVALVRLLNPLVSGLARRGVPRSLTAALGVGLTVVLVAGTAAFAVRDVARNLPSVAAALSTALSEASRPGAHADSDPLHWLAQQATRLMSSHRPDGDDLLRGGAAVITSIGGVVGLAGFQAVLVLAMGSDFWTRTVAGTGDRGRATRAAGSAALDAIGAWFAASTLSGLIDAVATWAVMTILGVPLALPVAVLTFLMGYIPIVGALVGAGLASGLAALHAGPHAAVIVLAVVLLVQQVEGNLLVPLLLARAVRIPPALILLIVAVSGCLIGPVGAALAVPLTGAATTGVRAYRSASRGADPVPEDPVSPRADRSGAIRPPGADADSVRHQS